MPCSECHDDNNLVKLLLDIKEESGMIKAGIAATNATVEGMRKELLWEGGRIPQLESRVKSNEDWSRVGHLVGPLMVVIYAVARKLGVNV